MEKKIYLNGGKRKCFPYEGEKQCGKKSVKKEDTKEKRVRM